MPHKHNADRRHHIPKMSFKVQNWLAYEAGLRRRGSLTLWIEDSALEHWQSCGQGGQARYTDAAIQTSLMVRTYQAGFGITIAFGLVPMLVGTAHTIVEAQRARALEINKGSVFARLHKSSSLIVPLMIAAIGSIQNLAFSMDSRAYGASGARTYLHAPQLTTLDRILLISGGLILAAAIALRATGHGAIFPGRL